MGGARSLVRRAALGVAFGGVVRVRFHHHHHKGDTIMQNLRELSRELAVDAVSETLRELRGDPVAAPGDYDADDVAQAAHDHLWQSVDGCADVIYTGRAWDIVAAYPTEAQDAYAEIMGEPFPSNVESLDAMMPQLAFALIYAAASQRIAAEVESQWAAAAHA
jgi:hypothetical protein